MKVSPRESVMGYYRNFLKVMKLTGYPLMRGETAMQYAERMEEENIIDPESLKTITDLYMAARYSKNEIEYPAKDSCRQFYDEFIEKTRRRVGNLKFVFYRYVLGRI